MRLALIGNPNSGKTTLFNNLTGSTQYVGNWPGVTVEKKEGFYKKDKNLNIIDLPGIYSLSPYTLEEVVARDYLINEKPDVVINIVDATNLERNLYLTTQLLDIKLPIILALNMMDIVEKSNDKIDLEKLKKELGVEIILISALKKKNIDKLIEKAKEIANNRLIPEPIKFSEKIENCFTNILSIVKKDFNEDNKRFYQVKLFELDDKIIKELKLSEVEILKLKEEVSKSYLDIEDDSESIITNERYNFITKILKNSYKKEAKFKRNKSDKIDEIVTNRFLALPIFIVVIFAVYFLSINWPGGLLTDFVNDVIFGENGIPLLVTKALEAINCQIWLKSLIVDGIIAGVGSILGFLPQMMILFLLLAILEDCGYMSRIAFVLDRIFRRFGLSGKSFIPMLISTGCGVPGVMASRTIENKADRRMTVMTSTFMPCGAKLPIIALISGALFHNSWWVAPSAYFIGIAAVIITGIILKKTKWFMGDPAPFIMELPAYHLPLPKSLGIHVYDRTKSFVKKASTIIVLATMLVWLLSSFTYKFEYIDTWKNTKKVDEVNINLILEKENINIEDYNNLEIYAENYKDEIYLVVLNNDKEILKKNIIDVSDIKENINKNELDSRKKIRVAINENNELVYSYDFGIDNSLLATVSNYISYAFKPIGFNWEATAATITGLIAKENVVGTFGVIYGMQSVGESGSEIWEMMRSNFTKLSAFTFLVFNLLCAPCFAAIGAIRREMNSKKWFLFAIAYQTIFAYIISFIIYQFGKIFSNKISILGVLAIILLLGVIFLIIRPDLIIKKKKEMSIKTDE